jgi:hypothetical protein
MIINIASSYQLAYHISEPISLLSGRSQVRQMDASTAMDEANTGKILVRVVLPFWRSRVGSKE